LPINALRTGKSHHSVVLVHTLSGGALGASLFQSHSFQRSGLVQPSERANSVNKLADLNKEQVPVNGRGTKSGMTGSALKTGLEGSNREKRGHGLMIEGPLL
jgi:hypothetical protein